MVILEFVDKQQFIHIWQIVFFNNFWKSKIETIFGTIATTTICMYTPILALHGGGGRCCMNICIYVHLFICIYTHLFICSCEHSFICSFLHVNICSYVNCWKIPYFGAIYSYYFCMFYILSCRYVFML